MYRQDIYNFCSVTLASFPGFPLFAVECVWKAWVRGYCYICQLLLSDKYFPTEIAIVLYIAHLHGNSAGVLLAKHVSVVCPDLLEGCQTDLTQLLLKGDNTQLVELGSKDKGERISN